ncbi:MAG: hypothetical protein AAGI11_19610 [Pseudomonadota bacterium]
MRSPLRLLSAFLAASLLVACGTGIQTRPSDSAAFEAAAFSYYKWRTEPIENTSGSTDTFYVMDPILRRELDAGLADKGYILDPKRAQFSVDYVFAPGMIMGEKSEVATNIRAYPTVNPNRQVNQAEIDNAYALAGVKETNNIALQFNSVEDNLEIWSVIITKIVEDANNVDRDRLAKNVRRAVGVGLRTLPRAP